MPASDASRLAARVLLAGAFATTAAGAASSRASAGGDVLEAHAAPAPAPELTLERIMADPTWIGAIPADAHWADDGLSIFFEHDVPGCEERARVQVLLDGTRLVLSDEELGAVDAPGGTFSRDRSLKLFTRHGDVFVKELDTGRVRQLTRTVQAESEPAFTHDERGVTFHRALSEGERVLVRDLETGLEHEPLELRLEKDPLEEGLLSSPPDLDDDGEARGGEASAKKATTEDRADEVLRQQQARLFDHVRERLVDRDAARRREREHRFADPTRVPPPFWLGEDVEVLRTDLSPSLRHALVTLRPETRDEKGLMPAWVTSSGDVEARDVRQKVGRVARPPERLVLLDLAAHEKHELDLGVLPGVRDDPLAELRRRFATVGSGTSGETSTGSSSPSEGRRGQDREEKPRPLRVLDVEWNRAGDRALVMLRAHDNKDRWIAEVDLDAGALLPRHRLHDPAWVNWHFNEMGWMPDDAAAWFLSEETGWSQLHLLEAGRPEPRRLTSGKQVVSDVTPSPDGRFLWYRANPGNPGVHEIFRVDVATGRAQQVTRLGGRNDYALGPHGDRLLVVHSETLQPPDLWVQDAAPGAPARRLTRSTSPTFDAIEWTRPVLVDVPSSHGDFSIHARLYRPEDVPDGVRTSVREPRGLRPAVLFIHGAGYLQDAHEGWSHYFREHLFHSLLTRRGHVVLAMDYRGSAGHGRDWRTAIYRDMGGPELEDLEDGVRWLAASESVDPERVGAYGGSYGGFLVLMALFEKPDLLAAGAALRPVTDWAHYNHGYTSNILNTPALDPLAFRRSSPIEHAAGLEAPLLICAPMLDDNVFFQDTVRLAQRLIELEKKDWEVAIYPVEPHGFREPSSWLDEYRRILKLFEQHLE